MFNDNPDFYPTPENLIIKMLLKLDSKSEIETILEPSAGSGAITEFLKKTDLLRGRRKNIYAIEKDERLLSLLRGQNTNVIDSDFLTYNGGQHFDAIIANFPFSDGVKHLHKAIDIMFNGQIVCLLNAQSIKNPSTREANFLLQRLDSLNADISFHKGEFLNSERSTSVEVALIYINIERSVELDLFKVLEKSKEQENIELNKESNVARCDDLHTLVKNFEVDKEIVVNQIIAFYENYHRVSDYIDLKTTSDNCSNHDNLTKKMQSKINAVIKEMKRKYWGKALELESIRKRLTKKKREDLSSLCNLFQNMEFSEKNLTLFVNEIMAMYPKMIKECITDIFDLFTEYGLRDHGWVECKRNIHYFNGWKTNDCYKVNKKIILPWISEYCEFGKRITLRYDVDYKLWDIERVINYFSVTQSKRCIVEEIKRALKDGHNKKIDTDLSPINSIDWSLSGNTLTFTENGQLPTIVNVEEFSINYIKLKAEINETVTDGNDTVTTKAIMYIELEK